jgi:hypothetical protein
MFKEGRAIFLNPKGNILRAIVATVEVTVTASFVCPAFSW